MPKPVFLLVSGDARVVRELAADLGRRFGVDYEFIDCGGWSADHPAVAALAVGLTTTSTGRGDRWNGFCTRR
jgi:hypothetical protein